ncbi:unnamed protein product [Mytilus coruscus]|uniref:Endonuclease/exonuclease/phosphatase domain-containing protein n=1 Tax=Mytilus coruscus TaxID=42192 RepID=A0A6J8CDI7_MYTCO|nr:unnamed protein product [Mytilus coruscus]
MMESNAGNQNMEEDIVELLTKIDHRLSVIEERTDNIESIDRKLSELTSEVTSIEKEVDNVKKRTNTLEKDAGEFKKKLTEAKRDINEMKDACNAANKVNVGIEEKPEEDTKIIIQNFISNELSIKKDIQFGNIHRFGRADKNKGKPRLIVAKFVYFADLRKVLEAGPKLKEKPQFGMNLQFPIEIEERRRKLYPVMKEAKRNGKRVSLIRDKLIIEGKVYNSKNITEESQAPPKEKNDTVDLCRYTGVYIVNGRIGDNIAGKLTSKHAATVDYFLATSDLLNIISNSDVLYFSNLFSDAHCPLDITININTTTCTCNACNPRTDIQPKEQIKKWNLAKADEFNEYLDLAKIETIDNTLDLLTDDHVNLNNINNTVKDIGDIFVNAEKHTFGAYNPQKSDKRTYNAQKGKSNKSWFDNECRQKRKKTRRTQRLYRLFEMPLVCLQLNTVSNCDCATKGLFDYDSSFWKRSSNLDEPIVCAELRL